MRRSACAGVAALVAAVLASPAGAGAAATAPPGYAIVHGSVRTVPSSALTSGSDALCPTGTVVWGGGVALHGTIHTGEQINTSDAAGSAGWNSLVDNTTGFSQAFNVDAICAKKPTGYKLVSKSKPNVAGAESTASVTCPVNTVVLSAGVLSHSDSSAVAMSSLWPNSTTRVTGRMINASGSDTTMEVEAVCGHKPAKYTIVRTPESLSGDTDTIGVAQCPTGTSVLGEGINVPAGPGANFGIGALTDDGAGGVYFGTENSTTSTVDYTVDAICAA